MSEKRQRLNELLGIVETRSEEQQGELETLTGEIQKLEPEMRAAIAAEPDPVVETRVGDLDSESTRTARPMPAGECGRDRHGGAWKSGRAMVPRSTRSKRSDVARIRSRSTCSASSIGP